MQGLEESKQQRGKQENRKGKPHNQNIGPCQN